MRTTTHRRRHLRALAALLFAAAACSESIAPNPIDPTDSCGGPGDLADCVPSWSTFSPLAAEEAPTPTEAPTVTEVTQALERFDDEGTLLDIGNVTFVCTEQEYSFTDNPELAIKFGIDQTIIWPGALIQGRSHRDGAGSLLELPIRERAPINVSVTFNNENNTELVTSPDNSSVGQALGNMIRNATLQGLNTANSISFEKSTYSSEKQAALAFGVSGRYMGFEASASGSVTSSVTTNVVAAKFMQEMYVAGVTQPATPAQFFSDALTSERFQQYAGQIGPGNPPLYVSRVGFGRMMVFSMSAKAEANEIQGALTASYNAIGGSIDGKVSKKEQAILSSAEIRISQVGGNQQNALNAISSGVLEAYFSEEATLDAAAPLWFELKSLTGEVAYVSEAGTYTESTCVPKLPGTFEYQAEQSLAIPFTAGTQRSTLRADVDGDGNMDLVFNERQSTPSINRTHVALANGDGTFSVQSAWDHPEVPVEGWQNYEPLVADANGDGSDDLVWNLLIDGNNVLYPTTSNGTGAYDALDRSEQVANGWQNYNALVLDLDGDGDDDLIWSNAGSPSSSTMLRTYYSLAQDDGSYNRNSDFQDRGSSWTGYDPPVAGQFDGFAGIDYVVNALATYNNSHFGWFRASSDTTGSWINPAPLVGPSGGWGDYLMRVGNVDGTNGDDLVWVDPVSLDGRTYIARNRGDGSFEAPSIAFDQRVIEAPEPFIGDFNNDGSSDIVYVHRTTDTNEILVGFGFGDANEVGLSFPAGLQTHPDVPGEGWEPYDEIFIGDVNGDAKSDIVWTNPSSDAKVYVALAK